LAGLQALTELAISLEDRSFRSTIFGNKPNMHMQNRKLLIRGLTSVKQQREIT
ncbi:7504_t:CDS:1, partial [Scutellospora calospora]